SVLAGETLDQRKDERGGLAGAGGGAADDVLAGEGRGDCPGLDGGGDAIAGSRERSLRLGREAERGKRTFGHETTHSTAGAHGRACCRAGRWSGDQDVGGKTPSTRPHSRLEQRMSKAGAM